MVMAKEAFEDVDSKTIMDAAQWLVEAGHRPTAVDVEQTLAAADEFYVRDGKLDEIMALRLYEASLIQIHALTLP